MVKGKVRVGGGTYQPVRRSLTRTATPGVNANDFWGPSYWKMIHTSAASFVPTPAKKRGFLALVNNMSQLVPCEACGVHWTEILKSNPPQEHMSSRDKLFLWTYHVHDIVNRSKSVPTRSPAYSAVKNYYYTALKICETCSMG